MTLARRGTPMPARMRIPVLAVWETVVFVLNAFAFVLIGMQLRPIWERLDAGGETAGALLVATVVLLVTVAARFVWVLGYHALKRWRGGTAPTLGSGIVISWAGMRGIVTLAAAFAIPETLPGGAPFPHRDLILLCAFAVVLGTLVLQGLTIKPLIRRMKLIDDDPVGRDPPRPHARLRSAGRLHPARRHAGGQAAAQGIRCRHRAQRQRRTRPAGRRGAGRAAQAPRHRRDGMIGDDAYRVLVQELDWAELSAGGAQAA